ncbi:MAG: DndE family protein [Prevotella sp.]|nr:DndE family protein [Prevotella sp.]
MFSSIKTSLNNKVVVTNLTNKFLLGAENVIARIAIAYSLHSGKKFSPLDFKDSGGKEYSKNILFGSYYKFYMALFCTYYNISEEDKDLPRYIKMHLDDGLEMIAKDFKDNPNLTGFDYLFDRIHDGLEEIA